MGGSNESEANALTVVPCGRSSARAVTTETGVHTDAITARNAASSTTLGRSFAEWDP